MQKKIKHAILLCVPPLWFVTKNAYQQNWLIGAANAIQKIENPTLYVEEK